MLTCAGALARDARKPPAAPSPRSSATLPDPAPPGAYAEPPPVERTVYRCGNAYSATPCGATPPLAVDDSRSDAQRRQAEDVAARDKRLAAWLEAQRRERDAPAPVPPKPRAIVIVECLPTGAAACPKPPRSRRAISKKAATAASGSAGFGLPATVVTVKR